MLEISFISECDVFVARGFNLNFDTDKASTSGAVLYAGQAYLANIFRSSISILLRKRGKSAVYTMTSWSSWKLRSKNERQQIITFIICLKAANYNSQANVFCKIFSWRALVSFVWFGSMFDIGRLSLIEANSAKKIQSEKMLVKVSTLFPAWIFILMFSSSKNPGSDWV